MNTKHYLSAILIFSVIFLFGFSVHAQNSSDGIRVIKRELGYVFYQNTKKLNIRQLANITRENTESYNYIIRADSWQIATIYSGVVGGGCVVGSLGYALGAAIVGNPINMKMFLPILSVGAGLVICSITFGVLANNNLKKGVELFNNSIKEKNSTNLDLGFSPGGVMLRLNF